MHIDWKKFAHVGKSIVEHIVPAVGLVEGVADTFKNMAGGDKENAVLASVQTQLAGASRHLTPALLFNARVIAAIRAVIAAIVALNQVIAEESAADKAA